MTPEQIEAKAQELLKVLNEIYFRNEIQGFYINKVYGHTFINFYINPLLTFHITVEILKELLAQKIGFSYHVSLPHFYYIIPND